MFRFVKETKNDNLGPTKLEANHVLNPLGNCTLLQDHPALHVKPKIGISTISSCPTLFTKQRV
ncbi:hypothetical protein P5673_021747 [Acropora cervicornis]|uniref:Uncharacterized protein n=1 Tax=Acropora cervicornis TaxID=6130 RepID=A0AAD9Q7G7_ACRCE|nr:hypothetical protein P5673_021747 [Acropora cervicornis]